MKHSTLFFVVAVVVLPHYGCDAKSNSVERGRQAVKEVVTQPFNALENAKDSLKQSEEKNKAALEQAEKEAN
jgi:ABC-type transporter MlaC component